MRSCSPVTARQPLRLPVYRRNVLWLYPVANVLTFVALHQSVIFKSLFAVALLLQVLHLASHLRSIGVSSSAEAALAVSGVLIAAAITVLTATVLSLALIMFAAATGSLDWS